MNSKPEKIAIISELVKWKELKSNRNLLEKKLNAISDEIEMKKKEWSNNKIPIIKYKIDLKELRKFLGELKSKLNLMTGSKIIELKIKELELKGKKKQVKPNPLKPILPQANKLIQKKMIDLEWDRITFWDKCIKVEYNGNWHSIEVKESRNYLNAIKSIYKFKNAPKLVLQISKNSWKVINSEVLLYYLKYLEHANCLISKNYTLSFEKSQRQTKSFFFKKFPQLI